MLNTINLNQLVEEQVGKADSLDPRSSKLFDRVLKAPATHIISKLFSRDVEPILVLDEVLSHDSALNNRRYAGSCSVAVDAIHGTIDRDGDFDYHFAPLKRANELRWRKVASAMLRGLELPPVELIRVGDDYFVKDGHHRISVARALGYAYIDALVDVWG